MQAKINGLKIGYDDIGQGPVVLFIHDYLLNRQMWRYQVAPLVAAGFRVILTDLRGYGESELNDAPVEIQTYSRDIIGLLDYLGVGRAAVCGLSFGGYVLFDLMENYPDRIAGACLVSSRAVADDVPERAKRQELKIALENGQLEAVKKELFEALFAGRDDSLTKIVKAESIGWVEDLPQKTLMTALRAIGQRKDYTFLLKTLKIPTLLIGAEQDLITHDKHSDLIAGQLPNCYGALKLSGGHLVNLENRDEFNRSLVTFLMNLAPRKKAVDMVPLSSAV